MTAPPEAPVPDAPAPPPSHGALREVAGAFLRLGCISFGGPIAHLAYFRAEFVARRRWLDDAHYADLVALCQFLPGPASSQLVFALGWQRAGLAGALVASACFTLPSALAMIGFAYGLTRVASPERAPWLRGLLLAAVAVVAQAVWSMGRKLCPDRARVALCVLSASALLAWPGPRTQLIALALGALAGVARYRSTFAAPAARAERTRTRRPVGALAALALFIALLVVLPLGVAATGSRSLAVFDVFYRSGSLVFGGGHVVLPLLRTALVPRGWLSDAQFLAGYGAAQALPGPLFTFAAYVGTVMTPAHAPLRWAHGLLALFALFLPAWLLVGGVLPFWQQLRARPAAQAALAGANAAVVGVLIAAFYSPVFTEGVHDARDVAVALAAFALLEHGRVPPWLVVVGCALIAVARAAL